jgi:hypothetical protein
VIVDRDFDYYRLIGQDVSVLAQLNDNGKISDTMLLEILRRGEILPDTIDVEAEVTAAAADKAAATAAALVAPNPVEDPDAVVVN